MCKSEILHWNTVWFNEILMKYCLIQLQNNYRWTLSNWMIFVFCKSERVPMNTVSLINYFLFTEIQFMDMLTITQFMDMLTKFCTASSLTCTSAECPLAVWDMAGWTSRRKKTCLSLTGYLSRWKGGRGRISKENVFDCLIETAPWCFILNLLTTACYSSLLLHPSCIWPFHYSINYI